MKMYQEKPKSAPPRLRSKFVKNRTNAMKEIEAWVRKDKEAYAVPEASRMSGQLSDNVTEERMLKAKLWELSKERYKFLSQSAYEQKVFQDRQNRKSGLRRISSASSDGRHRLTHGADKGPPDGRMTSLGLTPVKSKPRNARLALLDRLDPTKKKSRSKTKSTMEVSESLDVVNGDQEPTDSKSREDFKPLAAAEADESATRLKAHTVQFKPKGAQQGLPFPKNARPLIRSSSFPASENREPAKQPSFLVKQRSRVGTPTIQVLSGSLADNHEESRNDAATPTTGLDPSQRLDPFQHLNSPTRITSASSSASKPTWAKREYERDNAKYGKRVESLTCDPRYTQLEKTLCPLVRSKTTGDISTIVSNIESLHVRPRKRPPDAKKTKIELKAFEFMKEKGFAF